MKEMVLLFNVSDEKLRLSTEMVLFPFHVRIKTVKREDFSMTLGNILGRTAPAPHTPYTGTKVFEPMMIFVDIPDARLDIILQALRDRGVFYPYKAILTPTNINWTPLACLTELQREREAIRKARLEQEALQKSAEAENKDDTDI